MATFDSAPPIPSVSGVPAPGRPCSGSARRTMVSPSVTTDGRTTSPFLSGDSGVVAYSAESDDFVAA